MKTKLFFGLIFIGIMILNLTTILNENRGDITLGNLISFNNTASAEEVACQPPCSPGFGCVNGVCCELEATTRVACVITEICWTCWPTFSKDYPGHETNCPPDPGGITNCRGIACTKDS